MNAMIEMTKLFYQRPQPGASDETVAEWYRAKGRMHERLAECAGLDAAQERAYAAASYDHARRLELRAASCRTEQAA
ncbi:hypothetical protein DMH04_13605 [Kibdelosporangium aridum]|uniref:Uncharacterized protein n=1 Tax=Kibdelosporangium aridum TaxID=2030 RepID=A0A428ZFC3_KIBAR|nr:hypothetical protein [Kibdelosporangium aridum]RSM86670.1 hypothetical protein DMH04_13605 [Kibdelosporangium aridum]